MDVLLLSLCLILAIFSTALTVTGIVYWRRGRHLLKHGKPTEATIIEYIYKKGSKGRQGYHVPIIRFLTDKQELITYQLKSHIHQVPVGRKIDIIYDPNAPTTVMINDNIYLVILPKIMVGLGIAGYIYDILLITRVLPIPF